MKERTKASSLAQAGAPSLHDALGEVRASLVAQRLKKLLAVPETWVQSLDREDPLEKEMAIHSSVLAWRIPWTEEPGRATVHAVAKSWTRLSD